MTTDIVERLRDRKEQRYDGPTQDYGWHEDELCHEAAGTITTLRAKLDKAREALRTVIPILDENFRWHRDMQSRVGRVVSADNALQSARAALKELDT